MNWLEGKRVVVTGVIAGHSRATAEHALRQAGAFVQASVTRDTDLLITGGRVGATKTKRAEELGVDVRPWDAVWEPSYAGRVTRTPAPAETPRQASAGTTTVRQIGAMLAKGQETLPAGDDWWYEVKWDGYRCLAVVDDGRVTLWSRSGKSDFAEQWPDVADALRGFPDCVLDGELIGVNGDGLAHSLETLNGKAVYVLFDVLELLGHDLRPRPLWQRRERLEVLYAERVPEEGDKPLHLSPRFDDGEALLAEASERGLEGLVAKDRRTPYRPGSRNGWVKVKVRQEQEFVVIGWIEGEGAAAGAPGALLLGVYDDDGALTYVGKVGTGLSYEEWKQFAEIEELRPQKSYRPVGMSATEFAKVVWVVPERVVQVRFQRWTKDGRLWHPSLIAVRVDKEAHEVRREG